MANRYWTGAVNGGTGTWDASDTTNWSASSGGAGGASVPTSADAVYFDANSGAGVCTIGSDVVAQLMSLLNYTGKIDFSTFKISIAGASTTILNLGSTATLVGARRIDLTSSAVAGTRTLEGSLSSSIGGAETNAPDIYVLGGSDTIVGSIRSRNFDFTGFSGALTGNNQVVFGDLTLSPTMTTNVGANPLFFASTSATPRNITSNGVQFNFEVRFNGVGGKWVLQDALLLSSTVKIELINGTLDANDFNVTCGGFRTNTGTKTLIMGSGTWTLTGTDATFVKVWRADFDGNNFTVVPETATINMTAATAKTFAGAAKTYPTLNQGGAGALTIQQSNTFFSLTNTIQPATITLTSGTTQTVTTLGVAGGSGNLVTLNTSTPGTRATLTSTTASISVYYASIKDISATGGADWAAINSADAGNNLGWFFNPSTQTYSETPFALRSFSERRIF